MTGLAVQMEVVPEVLKRVGREDNMAVFFVPASGCKRAAGWFLSATVGRPPGLYGCRTDSSA
jgi:hypothetical protein